MSPTFRLGVITLATLILAACGGGGDDPAPTPPPPPPPPPPARGDVLSGPTATAHFATAASRPPWAQAQRAGNCWRWAVSRAAAYT